MSNFEERIAQSPTKQAFMSTIGAQLARITKDGCNKEPERPKPLRFFVLNASMVSSGFGEFIVTCLIF